MKLLAFTLTATVLLGCGKPTQILLSVGSDMTPITEVTCVQVAVKRAGRVSARLFAIKNSAGVVPACDEGAVVTTLPFSMAIVPDEGTPPNARVEIELNTNLSPVHVTQLRHISFVPGEATSLHMEVSNACASVRCGEMQTCVGSGPTPCASVSEPMSTSNRFAAANVSPEQSQCETRFATAQASCWTRAAFVGSKEACIVTKASEFCRSGNTSVANALLACTQSGPACSILNDDGQTTRACLQSVYRQAFDSAPDVYSPLAQAICAVCPQSAGCVGGPLDIIDFLYLYSHAGLQRYTACIHDAQLADSCESCRTKLGDPQFGDCMALPSGGGSS